MPRSPCSNIALARASALLCVCAAACSNGDDPARDDPPTPPTADTPDPDVQARELRARERASCEAMRKNLDTLPALPGVESSHPARHQILGRAKGWPVAFVREPAIDQAALSSYMKTVADALGDPQRAHEALKTLKSLARYRREDVRAILLPEGYFYASSPWLAQRLVMTFTLQTFFVEPDLWVLRGTDVLHLIKTEHGYRYADGPEQGQSAALLLYDRVATSLSELHPPLHVDFVPAAREFGFDRVRLERLTNVGINASIRYGTASPWVSASFTSIDGRASLACEIVAEADRAGIDDFRRESRIREHAAEKLRSAVQLQAQEQLPFDEPREEVGQQDGSLRPAWDWAYAHGGTGYTFNKVWYPVFDTKGRPHPPQVCIDFVLDSYERSAGTWYNGREEPRERAIGRLDFARFEMPNRRSVESVVSYFREHPGTFDVWDLTDEQRVRLAAGDAFYDTILQEADRLRVGDVVVIHGPRGREAHYHSFIVVQSDPLTGMPVALAENAGKPRVRSWHSAMLNAPLRSIRHVLRPSSAWLLTVFGDPDSRLAQR